jgi:putative aldouronate transport system substrate-binding protein
MMKSVLIISTAAAMLAATACSGGGGTAQNTAPTKAGEPEKPTTPKETPTIDIMTAWDPGFPISSDSPVFVNWGKKVGVKFNANIPPRDSYKEKVNIMLSSNELPDLFRFFQDDKTFNEYGPKLFVNLNEYIKAGKLPNLERWMKKYPEIRTRMTHPTDGGIYGFPIVQDYDFANKLYYVRNDMLKKEGLDAAKINSIDSFKAAAQALKKAKGGDFITSTRLGFLDYYSPMTSSWFNVNSKGLTYEPDVKKFVFAPLDATSRYKQWVELERWMYSEKMLDSNFLTMKDQELFAGYTSGKYPLQREQVGLDEHLRKSTDPNKEVIAIYPVPVDGKIQTQPKNPHYNIGYRSPWVINKKSKHIDAIIKAMDYTYSDEGVEFFMLGVEGETFVKDPKTPSGYRLDKVQSVWTQGADGKYPEGMKRLQDYGYYTWWLTGVVPAYNRFNLLNFKEGEQDKAKELQENIKKMDSMGGLRDPDPDLIFTKEETDKIAEIQTPLDTYTSENSIKFILGQKPMIEWDAFIAGYKNYKVEELKKIYNDKLTKLPK